MKTVLATLVGASLFYLGTRLNKEKKVPRLKFETSIEPYELYCGQVETVPASEDDPWDVLLEPCENKAFTIIGGCAMCEDCRDSYIAQMSAKDK